MKVLATIGYEGADLSDFLQTLHVAGIKKIIDVRDVPASRKTGFSKNVLARALEVEGISYLHLKSLGDPKPGREAAREGRFELFRSIFNAHLATASAQEALDIAVSEAIQAPSALLCYERDCKNCHRTIVATAMIGRHAFTLRHLGVQKVRHGSISQGYSLKQHGAVSLSSN